MEQKTRPQLNSGNYREQQERIRQREQEMFKKKHLLILEKEEKLKPKDLPNVARNELYKETVESRLHIETKAMQEKKREKFDGNNDGKKDGHTFGGRLPTMGIRAVPSWR